MLDVAAADDACVLEQIISKIIVTKSNTYVYLYILDRIMGVRSFFLNVMKNFIKRSSRCM